MAAYEQGEIRNFVGLFKQANATLVPDGALEEAVNCVVRNTGRIDRRRGFYEVYDPGAATLNQLYEYDNTLLTSTEANGMLYLTETGADPNKTFNGTANGGEAFTLDGRISRSAKAANNLYFTTNEGVMKLTSHNSSVDKVGAPPGLDIRGNFADSNGPIGNAEVAYRDLFGKRDANNNLILGAPGDTVVLTNLKTVGASYTNPSANLVEVTTIANHNLSVGMTLTVSNGSDSGLDGTQVISAIVSNTVFRFDKGSAVSPGTGTIDFFAARTTLLEISIPAEITAGQGWFVQLYRSSQSADQNTVPFGDFKLVFEQELDATAITTGVVFVSDDIPDLLLGAELYTNQNSQEGELQANARPPLAADIVEFKNHLFYLNVRTRHRANLAIIDSTTIANGNYINIRVGAVVRKYIARSGIANNSTRAEAISGTGTITITVTAHGLLNADVVRVSNITGTLIAGEYPISNVTANTFDITDPGNSASDLYVQGVENSAGEYIFAFDNVSASIAVQLRNTAQAIVKAINRDETGLIYATYASGTTDVPGKISLEAQGFTDAIEIQADSNPFGLGFEPILTTTYQTISGNDLLPNVGFVSKISEREAVPLLNYFEFGVIDSPILRGVALQDSLIVIKEDGIFRLVGDTTDDFVIAPLDTTVSGINPNYITALNNQAIALSNQGFAAITDSSVRIISHRIEDLIQPIIGKNNTAILGGAVGYESDRLYLVTTLGPNETTLTTTYCYNALTDAWTEWDVLFTNAIIGPFDNLYAIRTDGKIIRERKLFTRIDYAGQNYSITINSVAADLLSAEVSAPVIPEVGDVITKNSVITRIRSVSSIGGGLYLLGFRSTTNAVAADSLPIYSGFTTQIKTAPFHAGKLGLMKHFAECQFHFRAHAISRCKLRFASNFQNSSIETIWLDTNILGSISNTGWGYSPWGFFQWGNVNADRLLYGSQAVPIIRTYIPRDVSRTTYIQPIFEHQEAAEPFEMQVISMAFRPYRQRVTR